VQLHLLHGAKPTGDFKKRADKVKRLLNIGLILGWKRLAKSEKTGDKIDANVQIINNQVD
jgi:hypothetical protein